MRPRLLVGLAAAVLVAACGGSGGGEVATPDGSAPTSTLAPLPDGGSAAADGASTTTGPGGGTATTGTSPAMSIPTPSSPAAPGSAETVPRPGAVGSYAARYLRPTPAELVLVDLAVQSGVQPGRATLDHLVAVLGQVTGKPVRLQARAVATERSEWDARSLAEVADAGPAQQAGTAVLRLLFVRGGFAGNPSAVGVAVRGDLAAVFADRVDEAAGALGNRARVEDAVTIHEVGHLLGLVDLVLATGRQDPEHPGHSPNRDSVMFWAVESTLVGSLLGGGPPTEFDAADLADLAAIRAG